MSLDAEDNHSFSGWRALSHVNMTGEQISKENAEYQKGRPFHRCGGCEFFVRGGNKCDIVRGYISAWQGCKYFEKKHADSLYAVVGKVKDDDGDGE